MEFLDLKLINRTQLKLNSIIIESILSQSENELFTFFDEYLIKNNLLHRSSNIINQIFNISEEDRSRNKYYKYIFH